MTLPTTGPDRVGELRFLAESTPNAAITNSPVYWSSSYDHLRVFDVDAAQLKYDSVDDPTMTLNAFERRQKIMTAKTGGVPFKTHLRGLDSAAASGVAVTADHLGLLFKAAFGGEALGTTRIIASGTGAGATAPLKVDSATGIAIGYAVCVNGEARRVTNVSGLFVTLDMDLSTTPSPGDLVIGAANYYISEAALSNIADAGHLTLAALVRLYVSGMQYQARGTFPEITGYGDLTPQAIANVAFMLHAQGWEMTSSDVAADSVFTPSVPPAQIYAGLYCQSTAVVTAAGGLIHASTVGINPGLKPTPLPSALGENGLAGHIVTDGECTLEFDTFAANTWNQAYEARTEFYGGYQIGRPTTRTGAILFSFPSLTIDETPAVRGRKESALMVGVKMHANQKMSSPTDLGKSRHSVHFFPHL